jgi:Protein of unknown function (DUF3887)
MVWPDVISYTLKVMKTPLSILLILLSPRIYGQEFKRLDDKTIDSVQMAFAKGFASEYFSKQVEGSYYQFHDEEATSDMVNGLTVEIQKKVYSQLRTGFGEFKSLEYAQTWAGEKANLVVYRFRGKFGDVSTLEIRVVLNKEGKIAGFFVKPWNENL